MNTLEDVREDGRRRQNELPSNYAAQSLNLQSGSSAGLREEERFWFWQLICNNDNSETQKYVFFFSVHISRNAYILSFILSGL